MPDYIKAVHLDRMFPFEFYEELSEQLKTYTLLNPAFLLKEEIKSPIEKRKELFNQSRKNETMEQLQQNNLMQVEPFGSVLTLELCCATKDKHTIINNPKDRSQRPVSFLIAQLYDSSNSPVFAKEVDETSIRQIPEVLWDDPNLFLGIVSFTETEPQIAVVRIPKDIEELLFESVKSES